MIQAGDHAAPFKLQSAIDQTVDLSDHLERDKIVLLFFPFAFSSVCTAELCRIRDDWSAFQALDAVVLGISIDSPFVTERFRASEGLPFPILSDFNRTVSRAWGVLYEDFLGFSGVSKRAAFVIGADGKVEYAWVSEDAGVEPDYDEIRAAVARAA